MHSMEEQTELQTEEDNKTHCKKGNCRVSGESDDENLSRLTIFVLGSFHYPVSLTCSNFLT